MTVGGQAVIEGVMMRSPNLVVTSVRRPDGEIVSRVEPYTSLTKRNKFLGLPIIRGAIALFETLYLGIKSLTYSAEVVSEEKPRQGGSDWKMTLTMTLTIVLAVGAGLLLFFYIPLVVAGLTGIRGSILFNVVDGAVRLAIFFAYLGLLSLWKDMRRVFEYHGAEHKSIHAFEHGEDLKVENVKKHTTRHPRCGTSFLLIVMVISLLVFIFMGRPESIRERFLRLAAVPLIGGISYEMIKIAGSKSHGFLVRIIAAPGLALQRLTTREPDEEQIQVALEALKRALGMKESD